MKTIIRLLTILLAITIVIGATWAVGQTSIGQSSYAQGERPSFNDSNNSTTGNSTDSATSEHPVPTEGFDRNAAQFTSLFGWMGLGETVGELAIIIAVIALPMSLWNRYRRARHHTAAAAA